MGDLALADEVGHYARHLLNGNLRVQPVLVIQVNVVGAQPFQRRFHRCTDDLRTRIRYQRLIGGGAAHVKVNAKLGGKHDFVPIGLQRRPHQFLIVMWVLRCTVDLRSIKEGIAQIHCLCQQLRHLLFVGRGSVGVAHAHAAETDRRNSQITA